MNAVSERHAVTVIASHLYPVLGTERVLLNLVQALSSTYDLRVVCIGGNANDLLELDGLELLGGPLRGWRRTASIWRLHRYCKRAPGETTIVVGIWAALPWLIVAGGRAARTVVWEHSLIKEKVRSSRGLRFLSVIARLLYRRARWIVAVSAPLADDLAEVMSLKRIVTIPNIVDIQIPQSSTERTDGRLLMVGSLSVTKRSELAIQALAFLPESYSLTLIGDGPRRRTLEELAARAGVADRVRFEGHVGGDEVSTHMLQSEMLVHCATGETFGVVFIEAALRGLPVIATNNRVSSSMIPAFAPGRLAHPEARELASAIRRIRRDGPSLTDFHTAQAEIDHHFGVRSVSQKWVELLDLMSDPGSTQRKRESR